MSKFKSVVSIVATALGIVVLAVPAARAVVVDSTDITIGVPNAGLSGFTGPYANLHIDLTTATTADVTFTSLTNGGFLYMLGDGGTADLNVNGTYTLGPATESNSVSGFAPSFKNNAPGNVSSLGNFDLSLNNNGGFTEAATSISFTLTDTGAPWSTAAGVLTPNNDGFLAAVLKLTRFGGALHAFRGGFTDAQDTSAILTRVSPSDGRAGPRRPRSGRARPG